MRPTCFSRRGLARGHILSRRKRCLPADRDHPRPRDADTRRDPHIKPRGTFVLAVSFRPEPSSQHPALIQYKDHKLPQIPKPPVWTRILNSAPQLSRLRLFRLSDGELLRVSDRPDSDRSCLQAVGLHSGGPAHSHRGLAACQSCSFIHRCDITLVTSVAPVALLRRPSGRERSPSIGDAIPTTVQVRCFLVCLVNLRLRRSSFTREELSSRPDLVERLVPPWTAEALKEKGIDVAHFGEYLLSSFARAQAHLPIFAEPVPSDELRVFLE